MSRNSTNAAPGKLIHRPSATPSSGPPSAGTTICPTRIATWVGSLKAPYTGDPIGKTRTNANRVSQPQRNGTIATAHSAAVRTGCAVGVTPTTGSLSRMERVSQYIAIIPKPPKKTAGYPTTVSISTIPSLSPVPINAHIPTANRKTGLTTNRRNSRKASFPQRGTAGDRFRRGGQRRAHRATIPVPERSARSSR